jgi:hypothetical protein
MQAHLGVDPPAVIRKLRMFRCKTAASFEIFEYELEGASATPPRNSGAGGPRGALVSQRLLRLSKREWAAGAGYRRPFPALTVRPGLYTSTMPPSDMMTCPVM